MRPCSWLCVVAGWVIWSVVEQYVVLGDEPSRVKTTFAPYVSTNIESVVTSCSSSGNEEHETYVPEQTTDEPHSSPQIRDNDFRTSPEDQTIEEIVTKMLDDKNEDEEEQEEEQVPMEIKRVVVLYAYQPLTTLDSVEADGAQLHFEISPNLVHRRIINARLFFYMDPVYDRRPELELFMYNDTGMDVTIDLVLRKPKEHQPRTTRWVSFNVKKIFLQRLKDQLLDLTFILKARYTNSSRVILPWNGKNYNKRPFIAVNIHMTRPFRGKRDGKTECKEMGWDEEYKEVCCRDGFKTDCCRYPLRKWSPMDEARDWVQFPQLYDVGECKGSCSVPAAPKYELVNLTEKTCVPTVFSYYYISYFSNVPNPKYERKLEVKDPVTSAIVIEECECHSSDRLKEHLS